MEKESCFKMSISAKKVFLVLSLITGFLVICHLLKNYLGLPGGFAERFDMDVERSIPTWYSVTVLLFASIILLMIGVLKKQERDEHAFKWILLSFLFLFMSIDESAMIHELVGPLVGSITKITSGYLTWGWYIPALAMAVFLGIYLFKYWLSLPKKIKFLFLLSAVIFIGGAVGAEMITANYITTYSGLNDPYTTGFYVVLSAVEEGMETIGVVVFIYALLLYLNSYSPKLDVLIEDK